MAARFGRTNADRIRFWIGAFVARRIGQEEEEFHWLGIGTRVAAKKWRASRRMPNSVTAARGEIMTLGESKKRMTDGEGEGEKKGGGENECAKSSHRRGRLFVSGAFHHPCISL